MFYNKGMLNNIEKYKCLFVRGSLGPRKADSEMETSILGLLLGSVLGINLWKGRVVIRIVQREKSGWDRVSVETSAIPRSPKNAWPFQTVPRWSRGLVLYKPMLIGPGMWAVLWLGRGTWPWGSDCLRAKTIPGGDWYLRTVFPAPGGLRPSFLMRNLDGASLCSTYSKGGLWRDNYLEMLFCHPIMKYSLLTQYLIPTPVVVKGIKP